LSQRLAGKIALVSGAGSSGEGWGNGKATAALFAREGARIYAVDRDINAAQVTRDLIRAEGGICEMICADVSNATDVKKMVAGCVDTFGRIDILHNNVGISETGGPVEASQESWDRVIAINLTSVFLACKHALPVMQEQRAGAIVNVASIAGIRYLGFPYAAYSASKAAIIGLTRNVALQYAPFGVRANCVLPGLMNTPMIRKPLAGVYGDEEKMIATRDRQCPMGYMGNAWDTAYAALFLASDEARYITAHELVVDGGLTGSCV
jgi:NAD(P)-dependent dehydrogenase (short-subunit alcohol dehydrogenase family)